MYVSPSKASEGLSLIKVQVLSTKPKTFLGLRVQTLLALCKYSITALMNDTKEKRNSKKHMDFVPRMGSMWVMDSFHHWSIPAYFH